MGHAFHVAYARHAGFQFVLPLRFMVRRVGIGSCDVNRLQPFARAFLIEFQYIAKRPV